MKQNNCNTNWQTNTGDVAMSDMTKEEAIEKARVKCKNLYWEKETFFSNLYDECEELEYGDLDEWTVDG